MFKERIFGNQLADIKSPDTIFTPEAATRGSAATTATDATTATSSFLRMNEQVTDGLIGALTIKGNDITRVYNSDILAFTNMEAHTFDYYYGSPYIVVADIKKEIKSLIKSARAKIEKDAKKAEENKKAKENEKAEENENTSAPSMSAAGAISFLLLALVIKPKQTRVLIMMHDIDIWITSLKWLPKYYAKSWDNLPEEHQSFLYSNFCFNFWLVLAKWANEDFASDNLAKYALHLEKLLESDNAGIASTEELYR